MEYKFSLRYGIGDDVYHTTPDGDRGVVIDARFSVRGRQIAYLVTFGRMSGDEVWCYEDELCDQKQFN